MLDMITMSLAVPPPPCLAEQATRLLHVDEPVVPYLVNPVPAWMGRAYVFWWQ